MAQPPPPNTTPSTPMAHRVLLTEIPNMPLGHKYITYINVISHVHQASHPLVYLLVGSAIIPVSSNNSSKLCTYNVYLVTSRYIASSNSDLCPDVSTSPLCKAVFRLSRMLCIGSTYGSGILPMFSILWAVGVTTTLAGTSSARLSDAAAASCDEGTGTSVDKLAVTDGELLLTTHIVSIVNSASIEHRVKFYCF